MSVTTTIEDGGVTAVELGENRESLVVIERAFSILAQRIVEASIGWP